MSANHHLIQSHLMKENTRSKIGVRLDVVTKAF
jgi:hypothetical protein